MGLFQAACRTYASNLSRVGCYYKDDAEPLAPISHILTASDLEITLDRNGRFEAACAVGKDEPKIIIPVTQESAGRTSGACAHPLCDQLCYLAPSDKIKHALYLDGLQQWAESEYGHPMLGAILAYVQTGSILSDLAGCGLIRLKPDGDPENGKLLVRWRVLGMDQEPRCWRNKDLFQSFVDYYTAALSKGESGLCMVTGAQAPVARQHPKGVVPLFGNAKLISANDRDGFTYRGRFIDAWQATTVSYAASQQAHNVIKWLAANQGVIIGGRTFLCWSPEGVRIPTAHGRFRSRYGDELVQTKPSAYHEQLRKTLQGWRSTLPDNAQTVIAVLDAPTTGRLSLTYFRELQASDFLDRLKNWDDRCCWHRGKLGIQSPSLYEIVNCAYGNERESKGTYRLVADDKLIKQQVTRLLACRIDSGRMPSDIVRLLVDRASSPHAFRLEVWRNILYAACCAVQIFYFQLKGEICMELPLDKMDRSFQFGRLLAVMDQAERDFYYNASLRGTQEAQQVRTTNAIKLMDQFRQRPLEISEELNRKLRTAYLPRLRKWQQDRYERTSQDVTVILSGFPDGDLNRPLTGLYLIGYNLQMAAFYAKREENPERESQAEGEETPAESD